MREASCHDWLHYVRTRHQVCMYCQHVDWLNWAFKHTARTALCLLGVKICSSIDVWSRVRVRFKPFVVYMRLTAAETAKGQFLFRFIQVKKDNSDCLSQVELKTTLLISFKRERNGCWTGQKMKIILPDLAFPFKIQLQWITVHMNKWEVRRQTNYENY